MTRWRRLVPLSFVALAALSGTASGQQSGGVGSTMTAEELAEELERRAEDLSRYTVELERLESENLVLEQELSQRASALSEHESHVRARLITLCRLRRGGYLHLLRGASSWVDLVRRAQYARTLTLHDLSALSDHQQQFEDVEHRRAQLQRRRETQRQLRERILQYQQELEAERLRRDAIAAPAFGSSTLPVSAAVSPARPALTF